LDFTSYQVVNPESKKILEILEFVILSISLKPMTPFRPRRIRCGEESSNPSLVPDY
jgi:hypothetical protein